MNRIKITVFADPVCTWCWGTAAVTRALEFRFGAQLEIVYVMGGMIDDIRTFSNRRLGIGGDIELSNRNMLKHWLEASESHGMPVEAHGFHLFDVRHTSTAPQCMAYIAAVCCSPKKDDGERDLTKAKRYLRRVQEATAAEAMRTADSDVLVGLSAVVGIDSERFGEVLCSDEVRNMYAADKELCRHYDVRSFPTFLLEYRKQELLLQGFTTCETLEYNIERLTLGKIKPLSHSKDGHERLTPTRDNVRHFIECHTSVYPVEIATAFSLARRSGKSALNIESYEKLPDIVDELLHTGRVAMTPQANGFKIYNISEGRTRTQQREHELVGTF